MNVTVCQLNPSVETVDAEIDRLKKHLADHKTDFLLLPEMCFFDWLAAEKTPDPARWQASVNAHDRYIDRLKEFGPKAMLGTRPIIKPSGSRRNQAFIWSAETNTAGGFHEKVYLPDEPGYYEHSWYDRGEPVFEMGHALEMRIGVQICTEMWFFEWARHYAKSRADLLCVPRATPHDGLDKWLAGGQAAAICSGAYCLSSNLFAPPGNDADLGGMGWVIDPEGNILATTSQDTPFATVEIDLDLPPQSKLTYPRYVTD